MNKEVDFLLSPQAIRERSEKIFQRSLDGKTHFKLDLSKLPEVAHFVKEVTLRNYPDLNIPFHSRWGHFRVGGVDRLKEMKPHLQSLTPENRCRTLLDLVMISVLLDAGAGTQWKYREAESGLSFARSEGLAVASFCMFLDGAFSSNPSDPKAAWKVEGSVLESFTLEKLMAGFQVSDSNPLSGLEGRVSLLRSLGKTIQKLGWDRPGRLLDQMIAKAQAASKNQVISATDLLREVLLSFGPIWPGRIQVDGVPLGDTWQYSPFLEAQSAEPLIGVSTDSLVPFHKLSQWLTYSLIEPIEEFGYSVTGVEELTGLAEYRNGGLFIDSGVIVPRERSDLDRVHLPGSEWIVEWRALTIGLLDRVADRVRSLLGKTPAEFPLGRVLEGGTWLAGRELASRLRPSGSSPVKIESDGTVF